MPSSFIDKKIQEAEQICKQLGVNTFDDALKKLDGVDKKED